jgi:hypothetical protein
MLDLVNKTLIFVRSFLVDNITYKLTEPKYSKMYCTVVPLRSTQFRGYGKQNIACDNRSLRKIINVITGSEFPLSRLISLKANMTVQNMFPSSLCPPSKTFFHKTFCVLICFPHQKWNTKSYSKSLSTKMTHYKALKYWKYSSQQTLLEHGTETRSYHSSTECLAALGRKSERSNFYKQCFQKPKLKSGDSLLIYL